MSSDLYAPGSTPLHAAGTMTKPGRDGVDDLLDRAAGLPTANIADAQDRFGVPRDISSVWSGARLVGRAYTVQTRSGDNLFVHRALEHVRSGDVLVIDGGGDTSRALIGDLIALKARLVGVAGFVIDGSVRDADELATLGMPVFARGVTPAGPYKDGPGRLDVPVAIGGVVVAPGDLLVGDGDGVVVVPASEAETVITAAQAVLEKEQVKRSAGDTPV